MEQAHLICPTLSPAAASDRCTIIRTRLGCTDLFGVSWRISPCPLLLSSDEFQFFRALGPHLLSFYRGLNRLYSESVKGLQPTWVAAYLDQGKPESLIQYSRMKRFRDEIPAVIRPDVIPTQDGMVITELDSVPGGIGLTACLSQIYHDLDDGHSQIIGGRDGMVRGFAHMLRSHQAQRTGCVAILVSEESKDYRP
ncbi:MAG: hypothetical protein MRJ68_19400, partial [Nitrospira sp.]|nr:hypothetical protein [Nitrospira sp.]